MSDRPSQVLRLALTIAASAWAALIVLAPLWDAVPASPGHGMRATVAAIVRLAGAEVCHQRADRSFHLRGRPLAVCGRCTGLYLSAALGLLLSTAPRRRPTRPASNAATASPLTTHARGRMPGFDGMARAFRGIDARAGVLAVAGLPTMVTWAVEVVGVWNPGTPLRALAAVPLGLTAGWLMGRALGGAARI